MSQYADLIRPPTSAPTASPSRPVVQRACACGRHNVAHAGNGGECTECRKKRLGLPRRRADDRFVGRVEAWVQVAAERGQEVQPAGDGQLARRRVVVGRLAFGRFDDSQRLVKRRGVPRLREGGESLGNL